MSVVFLDTSVHLERLLHTPGRRQGILDKLEGKHITCSTYVHMELRRTILKDLCYVRSLIASECETNENTLDCLEEAEQDLDLSQRKFSMISEGRARLAIRLVRTHFDQSEFVSQTEMLSFLEMQIEQIEHEFMRIRFTNGEIRLVEMLNETDCDLAKGPFDCNIRKMTCRKHLARCRLPEFLSSGENTLSLVEKKLATADTARARRQQKVLRTLQADGDMEFVKGQESCWAIGATIKCMEAPTHANVYTTDGLVGAVAEALNKSPQDPC